ncbi:MAG TPA: amino acid ABC transporter permease [Flexivirga sp.]|uniref:amino acid ABC transporter permease n=1 Tax=Flexivirga sp. TaxID=1962927 RepID=UPI002C0A14A5|nr:amino acid ABC transporter permease [Flexivirga sp.]HWC22791.1 amino acid ABC transporter permease [Flexivirga sp.]
MTDPALTLEKTPPGRHPDHDILMQHPQRRVVGDWIINGVVVLLGVAIVVAVATNDRFGWNIAFEWFFSHRLVTGLLRTFELTAISMAIGIVLGIALALARTASNRMLNGAAGVFVWFFRGVPVFVQLLFWGFIAALYPHIGPWSANQLISPFMAAILGLGLNESAYMSEIVRAGLLSVPNGQAEAARSLGLRRFTTFRTVTLPQAMRFIVPPTGNQTISMLKTTSLVSVLAFPELLYSAQVVYSQNYQTIPLLIAASAWYLIVTSVLSFGQMLIERHYGRGDRGRSPGRSSGRSSGRSLTSRGPSLRRKRA